MIHIFDFEDGLQSFFSSKLNCETKQYSWDSRGMFKFDELEKSDKNIIILSKPYDCLQRGTLAGKYPQDDFSKMQDWSRRNWRYTTPEIYECIDEFISETECKLVVHPEELDDPETVTRIEKYTGMTFGWDTSTYPQFYKENINLR